MKKEIERIVFYGVKTSWRSGKGRPSVIMVYTRVASITQNITGKNTFSPVTKLVVAIVNTENERKRNRND